MKHLSFDTYFAYIANEMIKACVDYTGLDRGYTYIYIVRENGFTTTDAFFCIDGKVKMKHKLDVFGVDVSRDKQKELVYNLMNLNFMLQMLCEYNNNPMPKEIRVIYDAEKKTFTKTLKYENQLDKESVIDEIFNEWFDEVRREHEEI